MRSANPSGTPGDRLPDAPDVPLRASGDHVDWYSIDTTTGQAKRFAPGHLHGRPARRAERSDPANRDHRASIDSAEGASCLCPYAFDGSRCLNRRGRCPIRTTADARCHHRSQSARPPRGLPGGLGRIPCDTVLAKARRPPRRAGRCHTRGYRLLWRGTLVCGAGGFCRRAVGDPVKHQADQGQAAHQHQGEEHDVGPLRIDGPLVEGEALGLDAGQ